MPPKSKSKGKGKNDTATQEEDQPQEVDQPQEDQPQEDQPQEEEPPALEYVSETHKERYEYRPIVRSEIVYRRPEDRATSEVMTKFELCEVMSVRAKQLEKKNKVFTDVGDLTNPLDIAKKEILDKKCPLSIVRMLTDKIGEKWQVNEMAIPHDAF